MNKKLTPEDIGLVGDAKLSEQYNNRRNNYKIVEDYVFGFHVASGGTPVRIAPIYRATIYHKVGTTLHCTTSHEVGPYLNPPRAIDEEPDTDADALAYLAATALGSLEHHARRKAAGHGKKKRR